MYYLHQLINVYFVNGKWLIDTIKWNWPKFTEFTKVEEKPFNRFCKLMFGRGKIQLCSICTRTRKV